MQIRAAQRFKYSALVLALGCSAGQAQALPPGMTMHRLQTGKLDKTGWTRASSTLGHFSVDLPCLYNDFTMKAARPTDPVLSSDAVGCLRPDQTKLGVVRMAYRTGAKGAQEYFRKGVDGRFDMAGAQRKPSKLKGFDAFDVVVRTDSQCAFLKFVHTPPTLVLLSAEAPASSCAGLAALSARVFASFDASSRPK